MKQSVFLALCAAVALMVASLTVSGAKEAGDKKPPDYKLSGPYTHKNLTIFLVHGKDTLKGKNFLTLQEALEEKKAVVHETGNVSQLSVENVADDVYIYIHSGDIVRGGKQDRVVALDCIVPPKSGKQPLGSFCVESGRWRGRGGEAVREFSSSANMLSSKELKLAAKKEGSQQKVWQEVAQEQDRLGKSVGGSVKAATSPSSLQLSLEDMKVKEYADDYVKALSGVVKGKDDVVGFVFAINGKLNCADVYGSAALFEKFWPKLLKSSAVEALARLEKGKAYDAPAAKDAEGFIARVKGNETNRRKVGEGVQVITRDGGQGRVVFETLLEGDEEPAHVNDMLE